MAIIPAAIKHQGLSPEQGSAYLGTQGTGLFILNELGNTASDGNADEVIRIMGTGGALETDIHTQGANIRRILVPQGYRFMDVSHLILRDENLPDMTTGATIRAYGRVQLDGALNAQGYSDINATWIEPSEWWVPLVDANGANEVTLSEEFCISGLNTAEDYHHVLTLPTYYKLAGVTEVMIVVVTGATLVSANNTLIVGRFTT